MCAEDGHQIHHVDIEIAVRNLINGIKVAFHHDGEIAATAFLFKELFGDVGDQVIVGIDVHHHAFQSVVAGHGAEGTTRIQFQTRLADT